MRRKNKLPVLIAAIFISLLTFIFYLSDLTSYGATWDELVFHRNYGRVYTSFLKTGNLTPIVSDENASWFPPVAVTIGNFFLEWDGLKQYFPTNTDRFHLAAVLFGSLTAGAVFLFAFLLFRSIPLGLFTSAMLVFHPQFVTQAHTNVRDMGLTMFYSVSVMLIFYAVKSRKRLFFFILAGVLAGITTDTKQNGAFLVIIALLWFFINLRSLGWKQFLLGNFLFAVGFLASFFVFWPFLWVETLKHLQLVWHFLTTPSIIAGSTTFYDKVYTSMKNIPLYYPWVMLFVLTPLPVAILATGGLIFSFFSLLKRKPQGILFLWIFIPLSRFFFPLSSSTFDQIRHFFEVVPSIPLFAGLTLFYLWQRIGKNKMAKIFIVTGAVFVIAYNVYLTLLYRPYGTAYFNFLAGSSFYVNHAFDVEYWGNVYRKAVPYLNAKYGKEATYYSAGLGAHILVEDGLLGKLTDNPSDKFDYVIFMNKQTWLRNNSYTMWLLKNKKPLWTIEREGIVLFYLFEPYRQEYTSRI